ncbi:MAG: IclR family transcriptional regulator [Anaerolineales bacterium]|nr:IclR family transcriptional regulator [Anaerolineales bacterium]
MGDTVQVLERAMSLLLSYEENNGEFGVTELAEKLNLHKATVHRILKTLELEGLIQQNHSNGKYYLGWRLISLGTLALEHFSLRGQAIDLMEEILDEYQETVDLAVMQEEAILYVEVLESPQPVKIAARPGRRLPAYCTATGKAFLAFSSEEIRTRLFPREFQPFTELTILDVETLNKDLDASRMRGYAISMEEYEIGIHAVAAPVYNHNNDVEAVIAIAGPSYRMPMERLDKMGAVLCEKTALLTEKLHGITGIIRKR